MREVTEAPLVPVITSGSLTDAVVNHATSTPNQVALRRRVMGQWQDVTCRTFEQEVRAVAKGLVASGLEHGQRIAIMARTSYEWTLVDYAGWYAGLTVVPIYETSSAEQVQWILSDSGAEGVFLESNHHDEVFQQVADEVPTQHRWVFDEHALDTLRAAGRDIPDDQIEARRRAVEPSDLATIIYTSGTTGRPKGCALTHANLRFDVDNVTHSMPNLFDSKSSTLLFLPLAHVFGRLIQVGCVESGTVLGHAPDVKNLLADLADFQPTFVLSVPRVFEKVFNSAQQKAAGDGKGKIFDLAASTAIEYSEALDKGGPGIVLRIKHAIFDRLVYGKLRAALGGRVRYAVSGGAALGSRLGHFYRGVGITILEGYGLTETSAASTVNSPDHLRIGSVGRPIPGAAIRIAEDGEVLIKGEMIFRGYWHNESATADVMDANGWFHSGDIGELDSDGFLRITGRKKELIVTAGGKNVAPAVLEDRLRAHLLVSQCMVVGDSKPFVAALVTLDAEALPAWLEQHGRAADTPVSALVDDPDVRAEIQAAVDGANKAVSHAEAIKKFVILPTDWTEDAGQLTPSMKLKRNVVMQEFSADVEALYS